MSATTINRSKPKSRGLAAAFARNWFAVFSILYGAFVFLPLLAPVFMKFGLNMWGSAIYSAYSFVCHQLPQRSFFLFGAQPSYSLAAIQAAWRDTTDPMILRQFIGNSDLGWKMAWSDRMFSMYGGVLFFAWIWYPIRKRIPRLPLWGLVLLAIPMLLDGGSHLISDLAGIGQGFRDTNVWLAQLTRSAFPQNLYAGDALGSFNSWVRLITGGLFSLGLVWFAFPEIEEAVS
ncbi:MAG TPA: DUF2085 domain-containing protein [Anaerolineales bacterium]|nr:DUF2085 domain-containing protein [Anaerolineales bacterium]